MLNIFVNAWGNYNTNGADGGEWITLPMEETELDEVLASIARKMGDNDPEWAIHDYEWETEIDLGEVHELSSIHHWNELCNKAYTLQEWEAEEVAAAMDAYGYTFEEAIDRHQRGCFIFYAGQDLQEVAEELADEMMASYAKGEVPEIFTRYFDYEAFARDLSFEGYNETKYGVIIDC